MKELQTTLNVNMKPNKAVLWEWVAGFESLGDRLDLILSKQPSSSFLLPLRLIPIAYGVGSLPSQAGHHWSGWPS